MLNMLKANKNATFINTILVSLMLISNMHKTSF